jgi:DNA-binding NarL/FixJ family response regulator
LAELVEAIQLTCNGNDFVCGKVLEIMNHAPVEAVREASCEGITLTEREIDIVRLIAEGNSNKQIADELCLSTHTVNTHRKNIMAKLKVNNTAGLVMFAVKENLLHRNKFLFS